MWSISLDQGRYILQRFVLVVVLFWGMSVCFRQWQYRDGLQSEVWGTHKLHPSSLWMVTYHPPLDIIFFDILWFAYFIVWIVCKLGCRYCHPSICIVTSFTHSGKKGIAKRDLLIVSAEKGFVWGQRLSVNHKLGRDHWFAHIFHFRSSSYSSINSIRKKPEYCVCEWKNCGACHT